MVNSSEVDSSRSFELDPDFGLHRATEEPENLFLDWFVRQKFIRNVYLILLFQQIQSSGFMFLFRRVYEYNLLFNELLILIKILIKN